MSTSINTHRKTESVSSVNSNLLAEQFERDRKSIIYYCFTKHGLDKQGTPIHQYYTHVRVIEDQIYNNSKPPADYRSLLTNKKKRILIISYNKQLKEPQIHKARENTDGSIQIGRTWLLKELKQVINNPDNKEGFLLEMNKIYYWETNSGRERTAFIKTLVKIFMDHFANHVPELIGWDLNMWYLNETSYARAVIKSQKPTSKGLNAQPIVNQRVTSDLPIQDTLVTVPQKVQQQNNVSNNYHRRSPSVQGKPQFEAIIENDYMKTSQSQKDNNVIQSEKGSRTAAVAATIIKNDSSKKLTQIQETNKKAIIPKDEIKTSVPEIGMKKNRSPVKEKIVESVAKTTNVTPQKLDSPLKNENFESPSNTTSGLVDFYEKEDSISQQLQTVPSIESPSNRKAFENDKSLSPTAKLISTPTLDLEKSLEEELFKLNKPIVAKTESPVKNIVEPDLNQSKPLLLDDDFNEKPIAFESIENKEKSISTLTIKNQTSGAIGGEGEDGEEEHNNDGDDELDEEALLQIVDAINWSKDDDMRTLVDKFENKYLEVTKVYNDNLIKICNAYNSENKENDFNKIVSSINESYDNVEKVQTLFQTEFRKYENETYSLMKSNDNVQIISSNKKQLIMSLKKVIDDVNIDSSDLALLQKIQISTDKLYEIEPRLERLSVALLVIRGANQNIKDETWAYNLAEIREKSNLYETSCESFINRFVSFFENTILKRLKSKFSLSELSNIIPYNGIMLFIKLVSASTYQKILSTFNDCMSKIYGKLIDDSLFDLKELLHPRRVTIVNNNNNNNSSPIQPLFSSSSISSHNAQSHQEVVSSISNQSSNMVGSMLTSSINLLEFKNLENLLQTWQYYNSNKKIDILRNYKEPSVLLKVLKSLTFLKSLPLNYQNFITTFFHINDNDTSVSLKAFLNEFKVPSQRIINLNVVTPSALHQKNSTFELKWNLCSDMFNFKLSNLTIVITNLLKVKNGHLLNALMLFVENELLGFANAKDTQDFLFIQSHFKKLLNKIKTDLLEFAETKSIHLDKFSLSINKDNLGTYSQKLTVIVQDFIMYFYAVKQDVKFLIENLPIENFKSNNWDTINMIENNYMKLSTLILSALNSVTKLAKEKNDALTLSTNTLVTENDTNIESIINMNFLNNYCIDFLPLLDDEKLIAPLLSNVKKQNNEFFKLNLSEILIKDNLLKIYVFVKSAWAIINSNNTSENDPSKYVAYSGNNLNQILIDYDSAMILKIIENIYQELSQYMIVLEKVMISQLQDQQSKANLALVNEYIQLFKSKMWSNIQGDFVSFSLKLYSLVDKYYSKGPNKIETSLKFNKNDIIQGFMNIKKENNLP